MATDRGAWQSQGLEDDTVALADAMLRPAPERTTSPRVDDMQGAAGPPAHDESLDGQLGPDEISEPGELVMNNEAKAHAVNTGATGEDPDGHET